MQSTTELSPTAILSRIEAGLVPGRTFLKKPDILEKYNTTFEVHTLSIVVPVTDSKLT